MDSDQVNLSIPARPRFGQLVRVAGANIGVRLGWSIIDIDQLRDAIDESTGTLVGPVPQKGNLDATFEIDGDALKVTLQLTGDTEAVPGERVENFTAALEPLVDEVAIDAVAGEVRFTKSRSG